MKKYLSAFLLTFMAVSSYGQRYLGIATGDNSAIYSLPLNPASISGCSEKVVVNLFSFNVGVDNNLGTLANLSNVGSSNAFNVSGDKPFNMLAPTVDLRFPGLLVSLNDKFKQSFAFTTKVRIMNQLNHFDPRLFSSATSGSQTSSPEYIYKSDNFNWTAHIWSEVGFSYALQVYENGPHKIGAGVTLKYLGGISYLSLKGTNVDVSYHSGSDTFLASHSDLQFASNAINSNNAITNGLQSSEVLGSLFASKAGSGLGMDIGVTYTYSEDGVDNFDDKDPTQDGHRIRASLSVTDIGAIKYNSANNFVVDVRGNGFLTGKGLQENIGNWSSFKNYMVGQGFSADTGSRATKVYMPTSFIAGVDYQAYQRLFVNATFIANLANRQQYGNSYYSQFTLTPRYDSKRISVGMPISYSMLANDIKLGFGFRFTGFFFGSDDMMALFSSNQHGFGFYMGGYVPIYKKKVKAHFGGKE